MIVVTNVGDNLSSRFKYNYNFVTFSIDKLEVDIFVVYFCVNIMVCKLIWMSSLQCKIHVVSNLTNAAKFPSNLNTTILILQTSIDELRVCLVH